MRGCSDRRVGRKEQIFDGGWEEGCWGCVIPLGNLGSFMQQAGERQDWTRVHGVLKGTNLFCYRQLEDADTGKEPLFTIAINKVMGPLVVKPRGTGTPGVSLSGPRRVGTDLREIQASCGSQHHTWLQGQEC